VRLLREAVAKLFKPGLPYCKAGVGLVELTSAQHQQLDLLGEQQSAKSQQLMAVLDSVNDKVPHGVFLASNGTTKPWRMKRMMLSPAYTTRWDALPTVK
jgi:DNA polymerase V